MSDNPNLRSEMSGPRLQIQPEMSSPQSPASSPASGGERRTAAYYSPPPSAAPQPPPPPAPRWRKAAMVVLAAAVLGAGVWYTHGPGPAPGPLPAVTTQATSKTSLVLGTADLDQQATDALKGILASGTAASPAALDSLHVANATELASLATKSPKIAAEIRSGARKLYRLQFFDFANDTGEQVQWSLDGVDYGSVTLHSTGQTMLFPLIPDVASDMDVVGVAGAGGHVNFGLVSREGVSHTTIPAGHVSSWGVSVP